MTQKEQLDELTTKLNAMEGERDGFKTKFEAEQNAHKATQGKLTTAESERDGFKTKFEAEETAHKATQGKLTAAEGERDKLKAADTTAAGKAAEQLAKNGIAPAAKDTPAAVEAAAADPVALWQSYEAADATTKAKMRIQHGDKLDAAAAAYDRAQKTA